MKKLQQSLYVRFPPAKIYKDDIEDIYRILNEVSSEITIEADDFSFENIDELFSYSKYEINSLLLRIRKPYIYINFSPSSISFHSNDNTIMQVGLCEKIRNIIKRRKNWSFWLITNPILLGMWTGSIFQPLFHRDTYGSYYLIVLGFIFITGFGWWLYAWKIMSKRYSQIVLSYKKDKKLSFLERNKDNLVITIITLIGGGIITYLLT